MYNVLFIWVTNLYCNHGLGILGWWAEEGLGVHMKINEFLFDHFASFSISTFLLHFGYYLSFFP
jgi:hypothetical protein